MGFDPTQYGTVHFWLKPESLVGSVADGGNVGSLADSSGNSRTFTEPLLNAGPTFRLRGIGSIPAMVFNTNESIERAEAGLIQAGSPVIFLAMAIPRTGSNRFIFDTALDTNLSRHIFQVTNSDALVPSTDGGGGNIIIPQLRPTARPQVVSIVFNGAASEQRISGARAFGSVTSSSASASPMRIGQRYTATSLLSDLIGTVGEVLCYASPGPTGRALGAVVAYFTEKYLPASPVRHRGLR